MSEKNFVVFYAWQSDSPAKVNRNFIESALETSIKEVEKSGVVDSSPRLDKDTKDVSGIPDIANTILQKIQSADAFLADLTYVGGVFEESGKPAGDVIPNPNVMIELGYALAELGWERIVTVINTHYGSQEKLPFDLQNRRWPIDYNLAPDAKGDTPKQQKQKLVQRISDAIKSIAKLPPRDRSQPIEQRVQILETTVSILNSSLVQQSELSHLVEAIQRNQATKSNPEQRCAENLAGLIDRIRSGKFEGMSSTSAQLVVTIVPEIPQPSLDIFKNQQELALRLKPLNATGWDHQTYGDRLVIFSKSRKTIDAVTEISPNGIINATGHEIIYGYMEYYSTISPETTKDTDVIPIMSVEKSVIEAVSLYCQALINLGVRGTLHVGFRIINLRKSVFFVGAGYGSGGRVREAKDIIPPPVEIPEGVDLQNPQPIAMALRPAFDYIWREYNYPRSLNYGSTGEWGGLPRL